jgi:hypothetical protein
MKKFIDFIKSFKSNPQYIGEYEENIKFSISIGEICEMCQEELDLYNGGYKGKPTKCESCKITEQRNLKLNQLGI